jgi:hypothetical protein
VFFLAAGDVRSQKKRVRLFLGFRVFLGFSLGEKNSTQLTKKYCTKIATRRECKLNATS